MSVKDFKVLSINYQDCLSFCKLWHYSGTCPGGKVYYGLYNNTELIGVICYGEPSMRHQKNCYGADIELRRLCCIDSTPKNTESYFIGKTLRLIKALGFKRCIPAGVADPEYGHSGTIYRASNFTYMGRERGGGSREIIIDGNKMHSRTAYAKYGASGYAKLSTMFPDKEVIVRNKERKHIFIYDIT